jgi:hypothetical protein
MGMVTDIVSLQADLSIPASDVIFEMIFSRPRAWYSTRAPRDPDAAAVDFSDVQGRVFNDCQATAADIKAWGENLHTQNRQAVVAAINQELSRVGCGSRPAALSRRVADAVRRAANESARMIANTFNYDLAKAIARIGDETPPANYNTYKARLFGGGRRSRYHTDNWASNRGIQKMIQIAVSETASAINGATEAFYKNNKDLAGKVELMPVQAVCPVCQRGVAGNPYKTIADLYSVSAWPAHPNCVHYAKVTPAKLAPDCAGVWRGGTR